MPGDSVVASGGSGGEGDLRVEDALRVEGEAGDSDAGQGDAGQGDAGQGDAGQGDAGQGDAGQGDAGQGDADPRDLGPAPLAFDTRPMQRMLFSLIELELPDTHPVIVLQEADLPYRQLRITIGAAEGVAIAYPWRAIHTPKPLTHELFTTVMEAYGLSIEVVRITAVSGTAFSAELVVSGPGGARVIECRPSDAIALALRQRLPVPIMAAPEVLDHAGTDPG